MNKKHITFSIALLFISGVKAQKTQTYKETFNVGGETVLDLNTSHTDIEFDTWDKNQVEIEATVTLEEATKEQAEAYFKDDPFKIMGNSKEITVSTKSGKSWNFSLAADADFDYHFDVEPLFLDLDIPDLPELAVIPELAVMPPLPPMNFKSFDYERYKKEGNSYIEEWAEEFKDGFDEEYEQRMEEWGKRVEERAKAWEERNAKRLKEREKRLEERAKEIEKRAEKRAEKRIKEVKKRRLARIHSNGDAPHVIFHSSSDNDDSNILYFSNEKETKKYKVKKTIKIKMPKSVKLKMNVKHGEVKLVSATKDIKASLRYASLLASTIEGKHTNISASYSPVVIQNWSLGQLKADYSDDITLKQVGEIRLNSVSSNVIIDKLYDKAFVTSDLGKILINNIDSDFSNLDVSVQNGEVNCRLPKQAVSLYLNGTRSTINYPNDLNLKRVENFDNIIHKGFRGNDNSGKQITINSKYSEVFLE